MKDEQALVAVVDDDTRVLKALRRLLETAGLNVSTYSTGAGFINDISMHQPDCVVLDLHMPEMNGFAVQEELAGRAIPVPVIVITGHDSPEARDRVMRQGAKAYLCKPVDDEELLDAIKHAVNRGSQGDEHT